MSLSAEFAAKAETHRKLLAAQFPSQYHVDFPVLETSTNVSNVYKTSGLLSSTEIEIVELDATDLAAAIARGVYSAVQVTKAFCRTAAIAHQTVNCLAWFAPEEALAEAGRLDEILTSTGQTVGPLHGVPVSVKDFIHVKGFPQSTGLISRAGKVPDTDADIVAVLRKAGAVIIAKTTNPQGLMMIETDSWLGPTLNPHNTRLTPGGSSGGEGALLAAHGSPLGITTDIAGSTRVPAAFCGLWGFKPSYLRLPQSGMSGIQPGASSISGSIGPVAHSLRDLELFIRIIVDTRPWTRDISLPPIPWHPVDARGFGSSSDGWSGSNGCLRIGIMADNGEVRPVKPVRDALQAAVLKLEKCSDIELVHVQWPRVQEHWDLLTQLFYTDGGESLREALQGEPLLPLASWIVDLSSKQTIGSERKLHVARDKFRQWYSDWIREQGVDLLLCPAFVGPASLVGGTAWSRYLKYTSFFNLVDAPAAVFPVGRKVTLDDIETETPQNALEKEIWDIYDPKVFVEAPLGLQLAAPRWQDERLMSGLYMIEKLLPL